MTKVKNRSQKHAGKQRKKPAEKDVQTDRRGFMSRFGNSALAIAAVGGVGWYVVSEVRAGIQEADLSKIGNGIPTIVQIHDPQCPVCQALQKETRKALEQFEDGELQYLVANIRQDKGRRLANKHSVQHVTLLLFDGKGERQDTLVGPSNSASLERSFRKHLEREQRR
ncbi:MAG: thioredoxin family protein [Pseudomonadota bacterium]